MDVSSFAVLFSLPFLARVGLDFGISYVCFSLGNFCKVAVTQIGCFWVSVSQQ